MNRVVEATSKYSPAAPEAASTTPVRLWQIVGAAVRGVSHERLDLPCQDAQAYHVLPNGILLIALADGAGSAQFSEQGAHAAVDAALRALTADIETGLPSDDAGWVQLLREVFSSARAEVLRLAELPEQDFADFAQEEIEPETNDQETYLYEITGRDFASTLTCVIATADRLVVGQIGDGAVAAVDEKENLFAVTRLQRGEYANETHFLTEVDALDQLVIELIDQPIAALAVMSDGLIRLALKMPAQDPHAPFFQPLFRFASAIQDETESAQQLADFLASERVNSRTDDDKSLVLAVRVGLPAMNALRVAPSPEGVNKGENHSKSPVSSPAQGSTIEPNSSPEEANSAKEAFNALDREGE